MEKLISFIIPALNEEKNIEEAINGVLESLKKFKILGEIIVINDGSIDNTSLLIEKKIKEFPEIIKMISHQTPQGVGASFWDGVDNALGGVVVMFPGDNENDSREILRYYWLMDHVDFIIPFVFNKETRPFFRRFLSSLYNFIIKISFSINLNYTNGTVLCRKSVLKELKHRSTGFFLQTDILVRIIKKGYLFAEVPHQLNLRKSGSSKAIKTSSLICLIKEYLCLMRDYYFRRRQLFKKQFTSDSITFIRRNEKNNQVTRKEKIILDSHKLIWHKDRVEAWLRGERIAPITIDCALTRRCTYHCVYCYGQLQENDEKRMTKDVIFRFLDDAAEIGVKAISFVSDGESTCSPYLYEAIKRGKQNGLDVALGTNGFLLKEERLEEILPLLTYIRFNFSAGEPDRYAEIMGTKKENFYKVSKIIKKCVKIKKQKELSVTIGLQMVLMPQFADQIIPFAKLGKQLEVDYAVIKHCSDDELGSLKIDYSKYFQLTDILKQAESFSNGRYLVKAKWSKILSGGKRNYCQCYGPPFLLQISGSGLVAPCGALFNNRYKKLHIGNIVDTPFKKIWQSERYWQVMNYIASKDYNAKIMCGTLCLQHKVNEFLWDLKRGNIILENPKGELPMHVNFI